MRKYEVGSMTRRIVFGIAIIVALVAARELAAPTVSPRASRSPERVVARAEEPTIDTTEIDTSLVRRVIDGDTIELENGQRVRYVGVDTPETKDRRKPVQCFGKQASEKNRELVEGKRVRLKRDISDRDRYGRLLRYIYVGDTFVNLKLVEEGYARSYSYPPDIAHQAEFRAAERRAREAKRGLWGECVGN